jgi:hypothetical protein
LKVVHTQAKTIGDHDVMYKYLSKNLVFVATVSPKAAGDIGSALPEEASLVAYLIDAVTGRILHRVTHHGAQGPVHAVSTSASFSLSTCTSSPCFHMTACWHLVLPNWLAWDT